MKKKTDLRIIRTQKAIREAFLKLLNKKSYEQITIQEIAEEAMINRNTFYLHYLDKEDLLQKLSSECLNELENSLKTNLNELHNFNNKDLYITIENVFETIQRNKYFYQGVMKDNGIQCFTVKMKEVISNHISEGLKENKQLEDNDEKQKRIYIEYMVSGIVGVICFWLNNNEKYSIEEISKFLFGIHYQNIVELL